jgi:hypothetical protein
MCTPNGFAWPRGDEGRARIELRYEELLLLLNGIEAREISERRHWRRAES